MSIFAVVTICIVAVVCVIPLWLRPKALVGITLLGVLFVRTVTHLTGATVLDNLDDGLVLLTVLRACVERLSVRQSLRVSFPGIYAFVGFACFGIASILMRPPFDLSVALGGTFLACKAFVFGWAVAQFSWAPSDVRKMLRSGAWIVAFILVAAIPNALFPSQWSSVMSVNGGVIKRYGLPSMIGPFIHPFDLAFAASMSTVAIMAYRRHIAKSRISAVLLCGGAIATFLSFRRKDLLGLVTAMTALAQRFRWNGVLIAGFLCLPIAVVLAWPEISNQFQSISDDYLTTESQEARTVLTLGAWNLSTEYFPLGAGFGRYASRTAALVYSPEYFKLGFQTVYGLGPGVGQGSFLTDTSWPAILGETGIIGTLFFLLALFLLLRRALFWERRSDSPELRWIGATAIGWLILTLFQSTGAAVFTSPPMYAFLLGLVGLGVSLNRYEKNKPSTLMRDHEIQEIPHERP